MASSSSQRGAACRAQPTPDQLACFYKLVDKQVIAGALCRYARNAELSASAAVQAEALFGDDSLVVASVRMCESVSLVSLALKASGAEREALVRQAWAVLVSVVLLLLRRLEVNTLLPGGVRDDELNFYAHAQAALRKATNRPVSPPAVLRASASTMGYNTLLDAMCRCLDMLRLPWWPAAQKRMVICASRP